MNYYFDKDDEVLDEADSTHEERNDDVQLGKQIAREKKYHALVGSALNVTPLDDDCVTSKPDNYASDAEAIIERDMSGDDKEERAKITAIIKPKLPKAVTDEKAKAQRSAKYTDAMQKWDAKLKHDEGMRVASGFKPNGKVAKPTEASQKAEPWHVKEGIERGYIKGDKSRLNETLYQFFNDYNGVVDAFGIRAIDDESSPDHAVERDNKGNVIFTDRMTYDHKQRAKTREDGQKESGSENRVRVRTANGEGYDDAVRTITSVGAVQNAGYNPARGDLLLAERITDTKHRAEEVAVFVGPLLLELRKAVFENATAKEIGESLGYTGPQASAVGNAMLQRALEAASDAYDRIKKRERKGWTYSVWLETQPDGMPIPARKAKRAFMDTIAPVAADAIAPWESRYAGCRCEQCSKRTPVAANDNQIARQKTAPVVLPVKIRVKQDATNAANDNLALTSQSTTTGVAA